MTDDAGAIAKARRAEIRDYATRGLELARAWRLAKKAEAEMEADLAARRLKQSPWRCKKCKARFLTKEELREHRQDAHDLIDPPSYIGVVINPVWAQNPDPPRGKFTLRDLRKRT